MTFMFIGMKIYRFFCDLILEKRASKVASLAIEPLF